MLSAKLWALLGQGVLETLKMTLFSTAIAYVIGLPLGVVLVITDKDGILPNLPINRILGIAVNFLRSVPFAILMFAVVPITRAIVGTTLGSTAIIVPLVIAAAPFIARVVESSLKEVDRGVVEAAQAMGATPMRIVLRVLLPEALPSLITGSAIAITTILGYTAMGGFVGAGGLGSIAVNYGYYKYQTDIMLITVLFLVVIVQIFQEVGMRLTRKADKRNH